MKPVPEQYRYKKHPLLQDVDGNNGFFVIPHYKIAGYFFQVVLSDGMGWEHVSVSLASKNRKVDRCPTWDEMCFIKDMFFYDTERVVQYHPPRSEYVSNHPYCLHLWRPTNKDLPFPDPIMVGIKEINVQE